MPESKSGALARLAPPQWGHTSQSNLLCPVVEGVFGQPLRDEASHPPWQLALKGWRFGFGPEFCEHARPGTRHARLRAAVLEPRELRCYRGIASGYDRFQIVRPLAREKGRYFEWFRIACQRLVGEYLLRRHSDFRSQNEIPGSRQLKRPQALANSFADGIFTVDEERNIRPQLRCRMKKIFFLEIQTPEAVQDQQHGRRVPRSAPHPAPNREILFQ